MLIKFLKKTNFTLWQCLMVTNQLLDGFLKLWRKLSTEILIIYILLEFRFWLRLEYFKNKYMSMKHLKRHKCKNLNQDILSFSWQWNMFIHYVILLAYLDTL